MFVATIGFGFRQYQAMNREYIISGQISVVGLHTVIGEFFFGIGMVIAGGRIELEENKMIKVKCHLD